MTQSELNKKQRFVLASFTAIVLLLDNVTTWLAVENGAHELNKLVALFLKSIHLFLLFTAIKVGVGFYITYKMKTSEVAIWAIILYFYLMAILINAINALS